MYIALYSKIKTKQATFRRLRHNEGGVVSLRKLEGSVEDVTARGMMRGGMHYVQTGGWGEFLEHRGSSSRAWRMNL